MDKIILIMVICFSKTITRGSWGTIRTGLSSRKRKSAESVIIGINKSAESAQSVVLLLESVFCLRQTQVFTSEPKKTEKWGWTH